MADYVWGFTGNILGSARVAGADANEVESLPSREIQRLLGRGYIEVKQSTDTSGLQSAATAATDIELAAAQSADDTRLDALESQNVTDDSRLDALETEPGGVIYPAPYITGSHYVVDFPQPRGFVASAGFNPGVIFFARGMMYGQYDPGFDAAVLYCFTAQASAVSVKLGVYSELGGKPKTLLKSGTVDCSTTGIKEAVFGSVWQPAPGTPWWIALLIPSGVTTPTIYANNGVGLHEPINTATGTPRAGYNQGSGLSALPADAQAAALSLASAPSPHPLLRAA